MKTIMSLALFCATQALCMDSPQPPPSITTLIEKSDWPALQEIIKNQNPRITKNHLNKAELMVCKTEKKCYRSCVCISVALLCVFTSVGSEENSYAITLINRGSCTVAGFFANKLVSGQVKKHFNARRIFDLLEKKKKE